jgi:hypothetical protein
MKRMICRLASVMLLAPIGCQQPSQPVDTAVSESAEDHGHSHDDDAHDHSEEAHDHSVAGHAHGAGPHDGTIADWGGGKYHVEFTVDHEKQEATIYVLGGDEKTPTPIDAPTVELSIKEPAILVTLQPNPQESDPAGKASRFTGAHEQLGIVQEFAGTITGVVDGTPYSGDFTEESHGEHAH